MATPAKERARLEADVAAAVGADLQAAQRRDAWEGRLASLWAPVTVFAGALAIYICIVEVNTAANLWARPVLRVFGLAMLAWFAALTLSRFVGPSFHRLKKLRHAANELSGELAELLDRRAEKIDTSVRAKVVAQMATVRKALLTRDTVKLQAELEKLSDLAEKHLAVWRKNATLDAVVGFAKAFAVAMLIRAIIIEPFKIPSGSMIPTLEIGDQIFVNKFLYGVRIPWINYVPFVIVREPQRGDVVVFNNPVDESKDFIKRVIGVPGDRIKIVHDVVYVNGAAQTRAVKNDRYEFWNQEQGGSWNEEQAVLWEESLGGHPHVLLQRRDSCSGTDPESEKCTYHDGEEFGVPPKHVFVMGDNRDESADSRFSLGNPIGSDKLAFVPYGNIKGKAMVIWLALGHGGLLSQFFGGTGLRADRLFLPVR